VYVVSVEMICVSLVKKLSCAPVLQWYIHIRIRECFEHPEVLFCTWSQRQYTLGVSHGFWAPYCSLFGYKLGFGAHKIEYFG